MAPFLRQVRSFVRREGRMTEGQKIALEKLWPVYGIDFQTNPVNLEKIFNRHAPTVLDIGCGSGESTLHFAKSHPENNYLAIEVHRPGIGGLLRHINEYRLSNIRVINHDVMDILAQMIPARCIDQALIFFPDPWPKKRHHKRRLINREFLGLLGNSLKDNSRISIATDWEDYGEHINLVMQSTPSYINLGGANGYTVRPHWRPCTRFERRGRALQYKVRDFLFGFRSPQA